MSEVPVRKRILAFVVAHPAVHVREVERQLGLSDRLASYHLNEMQREKLVRRVRRGGYDRYFARHALDRLSKQDVDFLCLMRSGPALRITVALLATSEETHGTLARQLGLAKASTSYHLATLVRRGIVAVRRSGRERWYSLADPDYVQGMLERFEPTPGSLDTFSAMWHDLFD